MKIQHKRSLVLEGGKAKQPDPSQMEYGELAVNYNGGDPAIFIKDNTNQIIRIAGSGSEAGGMPDGGSGDRPTNPNSGDLFFDTDLKLVLFWNGSTWIPLSYNTIISDGTNNAPDPNAYPEGTLWFNSAETEAALYILYEDPTPAQGNKWIQIAGGGIDIDEIISDIQGEFVRTNGDANVQTITGTGGLKVEGPIEGIDRLSVLNTQGFSGDMVNFNFTGDASDLFADGGNKFVRADMKVSGTSTKGISIFTGSLSTNTKTHFVEANVYIASDFNSDVTVDDKAIGYKSVVENRDDGKRFSFYAGSGKGGSTRGAPAFFEGNVYIGGNTNLDTFQLWKSTLTEEQLEQFEAGTLAVPANVSTPGDGSFARHWYYNQQDEETQALLDSGELKYPAQFAAETFTDTFDLGENTKINLLNTGLGEFKGGVKVSGGSASNVENGIYGSTDIRIVNDSKIALYVSTAGVAIQGSNNTSGFSNSSLLINGDITGSSSAYGTRSQGLVQSDVTTSASAFFSRVGTAAETTLDTLIQYNATGGTNNGTVKNAIGFSASSSVSTGSEKNYGFESNLSADGDKNYNFYAEGTAPNYFKGLVESAGGINVTNGNIILQNSSTKIKSRDGNTHISFNNKNQNQGMYFDASDVGNDTGNNRGYFFNLSTNNDLGSKDLNVFECRVIDDVQTTGDVIIFSTRNDGQKNLSGKFIGYNSVLNTNDNGGSGQTYNFYAEGNAPNYFGGKVRIGGTKEQASVHYPGYGNTQAGVGISAGQLFVSVAGDANNCLHVNRNGDGRLVSLKQSGSNESCGYINTTGDRTSVFSCGQTSVGSGFVSDSDYRLKENIADLVSATELVKQLKPRTFNYIGSPETVQGFVAHELQEVNTFYATGIKDAVETYGTYTDTDGNVETDVAEPTVIPAGASFVAEGTRPVYQGVDQTKLIPLLTKALQEALERIEELESNTLQPLYSTVADLPDASAHHGKTAHVHSEGALYFAHGGNWVKLQNA